MQVRDQPSEAELRAIYGEGYGKGKYEDDVAQRRETARRLALLEAACPPGGRVLDVGCATGDFIRAAGDRWDLWGLDVSPHAIAAAKVKNPRVAQQLFAGLLGGTADGDVLPAAALTAPFDAIVMWDVIEHLWDPRTIVARLVTQLRPGGALIVSTPDIGAVTARLMKGRWAFMTPPEHLGFFGRTSFAQLLEADLGLRITSSRAHGKWTNLGFLVHKLGRVFPELVPGRLTARVQASPLGKTALYVPSLDVRYVSARKPARAESR